MRSKIPGSSARGGDVPIVFIHYGPAFYLRHTLACARKSNPDKRIFFLGDESNLGAARGVAEPIAFSTLEQSDAVRHFDRVFQPIQGCRHRFNKARGTEFWLRFVFKRWFLVGEFLERAGVDAFWTFDSDTLLLAPLAGRESRFSACEASSQCRDRCLNGFVGSRRLVERYTSCILRLFEDGDFLAAQHERLQTHSGLAFNEMDAFCEFRRREGVKTLHAAQPLEGEFFDDALAYDADYEVAPAKVSGRIQVKRLWRSLDGALYARHLATQHFVRMLTCNLSWLPPFTWKKLMPFCLRPGIDRVNTSPPVEGLREVQLVQPFLDKVLSAGQRKLYELRRACRSTGGA